jgi:O-antigen/teichoic acid export membrane protein
MTKDGKQQKEPNKIMPQKQKNKKKIAKGTFFSLFSRLMELGSGLATVVLAARYLGISQFGEYTFIRAIGMLSMQFILFARPRILARDIAVNKNNTCMLIFSGLLTNFIIGILACCIATVVMILFFKTPSHTLQAVNIALLANIFLALLKTLCAVFVAYEKMHFDMIANFISRSLIIAFFLAVVFFDLGLISFFYALALAYSIAFIVVFTIVQFKFVRIQPCINFKNISYVLKESCPITLSVFMVQGKNNIFVFFLKLFRTIEEISLFQTPLRLIQQFMIFPRSFFIAFLPTFSQLASGEDNISTLRNVFETLLKYIFIITLPICIFLSFFAKDIITIILGSEFIQASEVLVIIAWSIILLCIDILLDNILLSLKKQRILIVSSGLSLAVSCLTGFVLVKQYSSIGASWSLIASNVMLVFVNFYYVTKYIGMIKIHSIIYRPVICSSCLWAGLIQFQDAINEFVLIAAGLFFYSFLLYLTRTFNEQEIALFKNIIKNFRRKDLKKI